MGWSLEEEDKRKKSHLYKMHDVVLHERFPVRTSLNISWCILRNTELLITIECIMQFLYQLHLVAFDDAFTEFFISSLLSKDKKKLVIKVEWKWKSMNVNKKMFVRRWFNFFRANLHDSLFNIDFMYTLEVQA